MSTRVKWIVGVLVFIGVAAAVCSLSFGPIVKFLDAGKTPEELAAQDAVADARAKVWSSGFGYDENMEFGRALRNAKDYSIAADTFTVLIKKRPQNVKAYWERGLTYLLANKLDAAEVDYKEAIRLDPKSAGLYTNLAAVYVLRARDFRHSGELQNALKNFDAAIASARKGLSFGADNHEFYSIGVEEIDAAKIARQLKKSDAEVKNRFLSGIRDLEHYISIKPPTHERLKEQHADNTAVARIMIGRSYLDLKETAKSLLAVRDIVLVGVDKETQCEALVLQCDVYHALGNQSKVTELEKQMHACGCDAMKERQ